MRLALFDDYRLGVVTGDGVVDVTDALPWPHDPDPLSAGWWRRLCRDFADVREALEKAAELGRPVRPARLLAPALNPSKIVASASNYADHVAEMHDVQERTLGGVVSWMFDFDVFLKAPSSISGPQDDIVLPDAVVAAGQEIHHESELVVVIGAGGKDIPEESALDHVVGYTLGLDITVRSAADRSRRKSYDTFSPLGPYLVTADEVGDPAGLDIRLSVNGEERQAVHTSTMITKVPAIVAYASSMMTLLPGDLLFTGAPPGVGPIHRGDVLDTGISRIGTMRLTVR
ncbi:fumarylacetoacetate hydrolase family protein [Nonomuraea jiangxiensis]|uniref:2-keto-4-pentenoate hydratase/2-oxohepta-3-ene-1,7-dioic acid hydratase (Catechol pathway) n=1 Tax=Nonomuraea jiangxiensis TaxID=633440 RepID=A0A1G8W7Z9_9ACTN|nr:fumarylacetoacetate hydrolase family protein [Nonomuraea jiangxiensis]SDJ74464.1 2-keto-4-pentenoate hydratase/2-oxohepta-3-ene-1,7-dioic acid hydratase (catechol pathway) [Nonomuraea jiangxiensis]